MFKPILLLTIFFNFAYNCAWAADGIALFHAKKYEEALTAFKEMELTENQRLGTLIGQLYCNVALGRLDQIDPAVQLISQKLQEFNNCDKPPKKGPLTQETQQMSYMCRRHIREIANQMRQTVEKLVREKISGIFQKVKVLRQLYPFIDALEQVGIDCCQNHYPWACCMDPMLEQLEDWKTIGLPSK